MAPAHLMGLLAHTLLFGLIVGYAGFNRSFAYLGVGPIYITELALATLVALLALQLLAAPSITFPPGWRGALVLGLPALYLAFATFRLLPALFGPANRLEVLRNFAIVLYAVFVPVAYAASRTAGLSRLRHMFVAVVVVSTVVNFVSFATFAIRVGVYSVEPSTKVISGHAAPFAVWSALFVISVIQTRQGGVRDRRGLGLVAVFLLQVLFIYFSGHRSALLALVAGLAALGHLGGVRRVGEVLLIAVPAALAFAISWGGLGSAAGIIGLKYRTLVTGPLDEPNALWRYLYWTRVIDLWQHAPWAGLGFGIDLSALAPSRVGPPGSRVDPHNSYLTILARLGVIGALMVFGLLIAFWRMMSRVARTAIDPDKTSIACAVASCVVAFAVYAAFNVTLEGPYHAVPFWTLIGAGAAVARRPAEAARHG